MQGIRTNIPAIECMSRHCDRKPVDGAPLPLCGQHIRDIYDFACDCIALAGEKPPDAFLRHEQVFAEAVLDGFREVNIRARRERYETEQYEARELLKMRDAEASDSVVYYVRFGDNVKIGTTTNLRQRLHSIPHDELLVTEPGGRQTEHARHLQFKPQRVHGEWFTYADPLSSHIAKLVAGRQSAQLNPY